MNVEFLRIPGNGSKNLSFPGVNSVTVRTVLEAARAQLGIDCTTGASDIAINGESVVAGRYDSQNVYGGDTVSATNVVKGAIKL